MAGPSDPPDVICPQCGAANEAGLPACLLCRAPLPGAGAPLAAPAPPGPAAPVYTPAPPPPLTYVPQYGYPPGVGPAQPPAPGRRVWIGLSLALLAGVILATGAGLLLISAFGGVRPAGPGGPAGADDPTLLLERANAAQAGLQSVHYVLQAAFPDQPAHATLPGQITLEGDVVFPDRYTVHSDLFGERIVIGADVYQRPLNGTTWQHSTAGPASADTAIMDPTQFLHALRYYSSANLQDDVLTGTRRLRQVRLEVDPAGWAQAEGRQSAGAALLGSDVFGVVRLDAQTHQVQRLTLTITTPNSGAGTFTLTLSAPNAPVTIAPPGRGP